MRGIDPSSSPRGNVTGGQGYHDPQQRYPYVCRGIGGTDPIEQASHDACQHQRAADAERAAYQGERQSLAQHELHDIAILRAQRTPDAQFLGALPPEKAIAP